MSETYLIEIVARLRDEAAQGIRNLRREVDQLKASAASGDATSDLRQGLADTANEAERSAQAHKELQRQQQQGSRVSRQSESDVKNLAHWQEQAAEETTGHAESTGELRRQQGLMSSESAKHESTVKRVSNVHAGAAEQVASHAEAHGDLANQLRDADAAMKRVQSGAKAVGDETEDLTAKVDKALGSFDDLSTSFKTGSGDLKELRQDLTASGRELDSLSRHFKTFSDEARTLRNVAEEAKSMAKSLGTLQEESRQPVLNSLTDELQRHKERAAAEREAAQIAKELNLETERSKKATSKRIADAEIDDSKRVAQARQQSRSIESAVSAATSRAYTLANPNINQTQQLRAARQLDQTRARLIRAGLSPEQAHASIGRVSTQALSDFGFGSQAERDAAQVERAHAQALRTQPRNFVSEGNNLVGRMKQLDQAAQSHTASNAELTAGYSRIASGLRRVTNEMEVGSSEARKFGSAMEDAAKKSKNLDLARASTGFGKFAQSVAQATDSIGIKIISLSAALRGARLAGLVGLFQPIVTGLLSLAGGFFNVASGAGQAAATIGGVFISGLGQLIPMVSIGIASLIRLRDVFQAVQAAQAAKQEAFFQPFQGLITQLQNTSQLIESEQNLKNAYFQLQDAQVQVRESQIALTRARIDAIRNLQDLVLAEKSAELQLKNANLSVTQSEQRLRAAQASGSQIGIQEAQLALQGAQIGQQQATLGVPRARQNLSLARGYGIAGSPEVLSSTEAYRQSLLGVVQAQQQIGNAQRQMQITKLTLAQPASHETQQQATLQYLLSQMSAPEKALFRVISNIETQLRSPNSPLKKISDYIIEPFIYAFQRLDTLLNNRSFMGPITKLAQAMGKGLQSIFGTMFGSRGTSFFETMANDATQSIPVVTRAITGLMKVFEDIATAAAPAFKRLSNDWANFWNAMDARDRTPTGQARLTKFFNQGAVWAENFAHLATAIFGLFKALGHDAAPQGMKTVTSFTEAIHDATTWVKTHGPEVTRFFSEARQGLSLIGGVLFTIGRDLISVFNLTSLRAFAGILNGVVLPAATILAKAIGFLLTEFMKLLNAVGPLKDIVIGLATAFIGLLVLNRFISLVTRATTVLGGFSEAMKAFRNGDGIINRITSAWGALTDRITKGTTAMNKAKEAQGALATASEASAAKQVAATAEVDAALATEDVELATTDALAGAGGIGAAGVGAGAAGARAGAGGASVVEGGAGGAVLARFLPGALTVGASLAAMYGINKLSDSVFGNGPKKASRTKGDLASLIGPVGGTHDAGGIFGVDPLGLFSVNVQNQPKGVTSALQHLQGGLKGVTDPTQLSTNQLQNFYTQAQKILQMPDITATQRRGLQQLVRDLNPADVAMQKAGQVWGSTFQGISVTTGNVMQQVQQVLATDIQNISANLGTGTTQGAQALVATFYSAWQNVLQNTSAAVRGTASAINQIDQMLGSTLKAMGVNAPPGLVKSLATGLAKGDKQSTLSTGAILSQGSLLGTGSGNIAGGLAEGGWHPASRGARVVVAEGGHDEVTLTTDPRHAPRQRALLGQYLQRVAPHMAAGGYVDPIPGFSIGRTDMGVDANASPGTPIGAIGPSKLVSVIPNWFSGQPLLDFQLLGGPDAGRFWYVAEQITPVTEKIGSTFNAGQMVARYAPSGTGIEIGWAANASGQTLAQGTTGYKEGQVTNAGSSFRSFLGGLAHGIITGGSAMGAFQQLVAPKVAGVKGVMGLIAQGASNTATAAANQFLSQFGGSGTTPSGPAHPGTAQERAIVGAAAAKYGIDPHFLWGVFGTETSFGSNLSTSPTGAQGYFQFEPGTAKTYGVDPYNFTSSAYGAAHLLSTGKSGGDLGMVRVFYGAPSQTYLDNVMKYGATYAGGGLLGRHLRRMGLRHLRKKVLRLAEGGRAPWGGEPVPIIAHEGERISNPSQWDEVARMAGTTPQGLDHHLGYDTGAPRQHFADGGTLRAGQGHATFPKLNSLDAIMAFFSNITSNLFTLDPGSVLGAFGVLSHLLKGMVKALGDINKLPIKSQVDKLSTLVENFADPNNPSSTLNLLSAAFQRFQTNINAWVTSLGYRVGHVGATSVARIVNGVFQGTGMGGVSLAGPALTSTTIGTTGQTRLDALGVRSSVEQTQFLRRETKAVTDAIKGVKHRMSTIQHSNLASATKKSSLKQLQSLYTELVQQQETLNSAINSQIATTFQTETQFIQDTLSQIGDVYQTQQSQLQSSQSVAQAKGQYGVLGGISQALITSAQSQIQALQKPLHEAQTTHNADLVAQIEQQIAQLRGTIGQTTAQLIQDAMSAVQQTAQTSQARVSLLQTIGQTLQQAAGSPGQIATAFGVNAQALQLNQTNLQQQVQAYNGLLAQAIDTGNQGAVATLTQTIDQLTGQLAQNAQAIQDNTAQMISAESQFTQARGQFQTGTLGGLAQIISTIGQTTGFTDVASLKALAQGQNRVLGGTQSSLLGQLAQLGGGASGLSSILGSAGSPAAFVAALSGANLGEIESGQSATWINTFESLIGNLTQNTEAIATNNQQLAQLNGQLLQPQTWSTTVWSAFRNAIFSGMGNLLPQFQSVLPPGSAPTLAPIFSGVSSGRVTPSIGELHINHAPTTNLEPRVIGEQLAFETSNAL